MTLEIIISIFGFILTILGTLLITYFRDMKSDVKSMSESIVQLNIKLERVILDQSWHKEEMQELKDKLKILEQDICANKNTRAL